MSKHDLSPFIEHRRRYLEQLEELDACAIVFSGSERIRNHDAEYRFRPDSDFYYLTGFREPDAALVLVPGRDGGSSVLFLRERVPEEELWTGRRLGVERAPEVLGVDEAHAIDGLFDELPRLLAGCPRIVGELGHDEARDRRLLDLANKLRRRARGGVRPPVEWIDPSSVLHELRLLKTEPELARMRRAAEISAEAHLAAMAAAGHGVGEHELDALLDYTFRRRGGTGAAYTNIVAGGENACILHYVSNDRPLADGELCLIDAGCEYDFYASDVTRTFPVGGRFLDARRELYEVVLEAQQAALAAVRPGATLDDVHAAATLRLCEGMVAVGLLRGDVAALHEQGAHRRYMMHGTSHWLGLDVHDRGQYQLDGKPRPLVPGMVLTVEPGLYVAADDEQAAARWRGIGIRIEDDVLVTAEGHENLTAAIPKAIDEVEAACAADPLHR